MKAIFLIAVVFLQSFLASFSVPVDVKAIDLVERECKDNRNDCSWIAANNKDVQKYCNEHRNDLFIKDCTKTCGFCRAPAPPKECEDTRDDCSWIAEYNDDVADYCDRHKNDAFIKQCTKTCGFCKAPAPPQPQICEDTRSDCNWIVENNEDVDAYCKLYRNDPAVKECAKTCGFCKAPAPPKPQICEDTREDCKWIRENIRDIPKYCHSWKNDAAVKECRKTCGFC